MRELDHIGIPSEEKRPGEMYVAETKVWVTDPTQHPQHLEFLRFEPDSPVTGPLRTQPHIAFRVESLERATEGEQVILGPFQATDNLKVVFIAKDGALYEFMEATAAGHWHTKAEA